MPKPSKTLKARLAMAEYLTQLALMKPDSAFRVAWKERERLEAIQSRDADEQGILLACNDYLARSQKGPVKAEKSPPRCSSRP